MAFAKALKPVRIAQGSPAHWVLRLMGFGIIVYLALSPFFRNLKANEYGQLIDILILGLAATSLNLLVGFTGQISIGHSAFFGIGAYTTAILMHNYGWDPQWTFPMAVLLCFAVGVLVGIPALRLTGIYLSLVTLALAQLFPALVRKFDNLTGGSRGIQNLRYDPPSWTGLSHSTLDRSIWLYTVALTFMVIGYVVVRNLVKSRVGRAMVAVRDNTTAAAVMGVHVAVVKTVTFGISAALCGLAGSVFVLRQTQANPDNVYYTILGAIIFLVIMVIGGTASLLGPIVGAFVYYRVDEFTRSLPSKDWLPGVAKDFLRDRPNLATVVFSALLILLMFVAPFGIVGLAKRIGRRFVVLVPRPPGGGGGEQQAGTAPEAVEAIPATPLETAASAFPTQGGP
jgi:branched-chain amino acid transport system permease protein